MPYQKTKEGRLVNEVTLGDGYPLSNDLQPLKVGGEASPIEMSTSLPDNSDNAKVKVRGDLEVTGGLNFKNDVEVDLSFDDLSLSGDLDATGTVTSSAGVCQGEQKHLIQINARVYNRYDHWFYPTFTWGTNAENWNSTRSSSSLETTWFDSWNPILVVPHNMTLNEYYMYGNSTATHTIEHALLHGTGVTWDDTNADDFSLTQIGSTQSGAWTSGRYNKLGQTGLSVDLDEGDMIMPAFRRTTDAASATYSYLEICFVAVCTLR